MKASRTVPPKREQNRRHSTGNTKSVKKPAFPVTQGSAKLADIQATADEDTAEEITVAEKDALIPDSADNKGDPLTDEKEGNDGDGSEGAICSARSDEDALVGFPSQSEHRTLLRQVKLSMKEQTEKAAQRKNSFLERRSSVIDRLQLLSVNRETRRQSHISQADMDDLDKLI